jgi:hypothetical protein
VVVKDGYIDKEDMELFKQMDNIDEIVDYIDQWYIKNSTKLIGEND